MPGLRGISLLPRFTKIIENMETDQYVTMTIFQLEKEFGDSDEAKEFIAELIKGISPASSTCIYSIPNVLVCIVTAHTYL